VTHRLLLDTHVALWLDSGDERLRSSTRVSIDGCWKNGGTIFLSAVTAWEIALLVDTGRIDLDIPVDASKRCRSAIRLPPAATSCIILNTAIRRIGC